MGKKWLYTAILPWLLLSAAPTGGWKRLNVTHFSISVPKGWSYQIRKGEDSFVGIIRTKRSYLSFDYSIQGYANHLTPSAQEYLNSKEWLRDCPLYKTDVTYTAPYNVKNEKARQMREKGIKDPNLIKVEADPCMVAQKNVHLPTPQQHAKYPTADYIGDLVYKGETTYVPIQLPEMIKNENIRVDTTDKYIIKTVWPKTHGRGITGIYIKYRKSRINFNLESSNLSQQEEEQALRAFKTIVFKK